MNLLLLLFYLLQIPQDIPHQTEPVDFRQWENILLYLVTPLLLAALYFFYFRKRNKR
ncbi:MAG: hypothetical protein KatS3mg032_1730 [Cyclobacteriaceae bacterium]|nr:MAG: hypothetical protein KatS3mg032_1730 [Cyclobacteriaceae bacterium]